MLHAWEQCGAWEQVRSGPMEIYQVAGDGLPDMRFHDLRHSMATILLVAGIHPKVVQERLGHSSIAMTMDVYSHVLPIMQEDVARKFDEML